MFFLTQDVVDDVIDEIDDAIAESLTLIDASDGAVFSVASLDGVISSAKLLLVKSIRLLTDALIGLSR